MMVATETLISLRRSDPIRLPPLIPIQYTATRKSPQRSPVLLPRLRMESTESGSSSSEGDMNVVESIQNRTIFVCGFVNKRWHNSSLQSVIYDLIPHYYVACNDDNDMEQTKTRDLLSHADAILFFVNEFTLGDQNCLLTLQYAWQIMVPIIMLRPPRTKLVICKRSQKRRDDMRVVGSGSIIRSPSARWTLVDEDTTTRVDYGLLQDILYEGLGYKLSVVYDRLEHLKSMNRIKERINSVLKYESFAENNEKTDFYLSPSNDSSKRTKKESKQEIRLSRSLNNLESQQARIKKVQGTPRKPRNHQILLPTENSTDDELNAISPEILSNSERMEDAINGNDKSSESRTPTPKLAVKELENDKQKTPTLQRQSTQSRQTSLDRRMSMSSLDDRRNYITTQYLLFPLRDSQKKPQLIRFPDDVLEETWRDDGSVWGSDTSLEEEIDLAPRINAGISVDEDDNLSLTFSPPPAPYIDPL